MKLCVSSIVHCRDRLYVASIHDQGLTMLPIYPPSLSICTNCIFPISIQHESDDKYTCSFLYKWVQDVLSRSSLSTTIARQIQQTQLRASTESFPIFVSFVQLTWKPILLKLLMLWQRGFVIHSFIPPFHPGYCSDLFAGHLSTPPPKGIIGYNGEAGYRRNTFDLRRRPSVFGDTEEGAYSWVHVTDPVMWPLCVEKLYLYITV